MPDHAVDVDKKLLSLIEEVEPERALDRLRGAEYLQRKLTGSTVTNWQPCRTPSAAT